MCSFSTLWKVPIFVSRLQCGKFLLVDVLSLERSCLYGELLYTDNDFHFNLGFKFSTQAMVFTLNLDSRKGSLHRQ